MGKNEAVRCTGWSLHATARAYKTQIRACLFLLSLPLADALRFARFHIFIDAGKKK